MCASHLDTDEDGLLDHWETKGVDIDQDGAIDLNLATMGANPLHKDLFLEIDWLTRDGSKDFSPQPAALAFLRDAFALAPVPNPDGVPGITVHIDAGRRKVPGTSLSINMGVGPLEGGDQISANGQHIAVVYFGPNGSVNFPGVVTRSFTDIKQNLSTHDKGCESGFHYVLFADRHTAPNVGSSGLAEIGFYGPSDDESIPGNDVIVSLQGLRDPQNLRVPPLSPTSSTIPTPLGFLQGQTLLHELGHNLGLRHGGINSQTSSPPGHPNFVSAFVNRTPEYRSVMNYSYQFYPDTAGTLVRDYSRSSGAGIFNDWANLKLDFSSYLDYLSVSTNKGRGGPIDAFQQPEPDIEVLQQIHGPFDGQSPVATIVQPSPNVASPCSAVR